MTQKAKLRLQIHNRINRVMHILPPVNIIFQLFIDICAVVLEQSSVNYFIFKYNRINGM